MKNNLIIIIKKPSVMLSVVNKIEKIEKWITFNYLRIISIQKLFRFNIRFIEEKLNL